MPRTPFRTPLIINTSLLAKVQPTLDYLKQQSAYLDGVIESTWQAEDNVRAQKTLNEFKKTVQDAALLREGVEVLERILDSDSHIDIGATEYPREKKPQTRQTRQRRCAGASRGSRGSRSGVVSPEGEIRILNVDYNDPAVVRRVAD